jgi:VWFA-related protein
MRLLLPLVPVRSAPVAAAAAVLLLLANSSPRGQQAETPPQFRTGTNVIRVDATVVDGRGRPVTSLTADDFEVRDDGLLQTVTTFKLVEATGQATDEQSLEIRNPGHAAAEAAKDDVRVFLVFWDDYHIEEFLSARHAREDLTRAMLDAFAPADLVAVIDPLTPTDAIRFTRDRRALANQVHSLKGRRGVYTPPRSGVEELHLMNLRRIEQIRCQVTESAVTASAAHLGTLREGPSAMIIVSEGFGPCGPPEDESRRLRDLIRAASDGHTAIFVADPRGLQVNRRMSMFLQSLASETGGDALQTNDLGVLVKRAVTQAGAFYLLGYSKDVPMDGRYHEIKVRVKRRGLEVRSRAGYWTPRAADVAHAKATAAAAEVTPAVAEANARLLPVDAPRPVDIWIGTTPVDARRTQVTVAWTTRRAPPDAEHGPADLSVTATAEGRPVFQGPIAPDGTSFDASAGPLQLAFVIRNAAGDVVDRETRLLAVPDPASPGLALSTPVVSRARTLKESREPRLPVYAGRDFARTDRVMIRFAVAGGSQEPTDLSAGLLTKGGTRLAALDVRPEGTGGMYLIDLPLTSIAPGAFIVSIEASRGAERAAALVAFRVIP